MCDIGIFQLGTYTIALCAKELNKPVYVLCESYKFVRLYPLNQQDMPNEFKVVTFFKIGPTPDPIL